MNPANKSSQGGLPAEGPGLKMAPERLIQLGVHSTEPESFGNSRMQMFLGNDDLTAQRHFLRFRCGGPGL